MHQWPTATLPRTAIATDALDGSAAQTPAKHLQCMEVWGGNRAVETSVVMPGLDAWIYSRPAPEDSGGVTHFANSSITETPIAAAPAFADVGGGDVHYVSSCAGGALSRMLIADVAGHGPAVAELAKRLRRIMQRHIVQHEQTGFVRSLNREFLKLAESQRQSGRFATAVAFTYDAPINRLQVCNAGHPAPLVWRHADRSWSPLSVPLDAPAVRNVPLGILEGIDYEQFQSPIEIGDLVLSFTDALTEARRGTEQLGERGLLDLLGNGASAGVDPHRPQDLIPELISRLTACGWTVHDDLTILLFRPNGLRPTIPLLDRLMAPLRFARGMVVPVRS